MPFCRKDFILRDSIRIPLLLTVLAGVLLSVFALSVIPSKPALAREETLQELEERKAWDEKRK